MIDELSTATRILRLRVRYGAYNTELRFFHLPFDRSAWVVELSVIKGSNATLLVGPAPADVLLTALEEEAPGAPGASHPIGSN